MKRKEAEKAAAKEPKEKMFDIKVNKKALENFMAKMFWYTLAAITALATILLIISIKEFYFAWQSVVPSLVEAWGSIKTPFISTIICISWFCLVFTVVISLFYFHIIISIVAENFSVYIRVLIMNYIICWSNFSFCS